MTYDVHRAVSDERAPSVGRSEVRERANALVRDRLPLARELGRRLRPLVDDPELFRAELTAGLRFLADEAYLAELSRVAPGAGPALGVRLPLLRAVQAGVRPGLRARTPSSSVWLAERLVRDDLREVRLFSILPLRRSLPDEPEQTWQVIRRLARGASDWIGVDTLAPLVAEGILRAPYRWAELEQLVYSLNLWERRLVGATIATMPFLVVPTARDRLPGARSALGLIRSLLGDPEPDVQKALSWALRSWYEVDMGGVTTLIREEAEQALATGDGHRAWVIRDALSAVPAEVAADLRPRLTQVRRRATAPGTSTAGETARAFVGLLDLGSAVAEPIDRGGSYLQAPDPRETAENSTSSERQGAAR